MAINHTLIRYMNEFLVVISIVSIVSVNITIKLACRIIDYGFTFGNEIIERVIDHGPNSCFHIESVLHSFNKGILGLDDGFKVNNFPIPFFGHMRGFTSHLRDSSE